MTCVCQSEVIVCKRELSETRSGSVLQETRRWRALRTGRVLSGDVPHIDAHSMLRWTPLLKVFLQDQEKELTALKALGDLMIRMQHPEGVCLSASGMFKCVFMFTSLPCCLISVLTLVRRLHRPAADDPGRPHRRRDHPGEHVPEVEEL